VLNGSFSTVGWTGVRESTSLRRTLHARFVAMAIDKLVAPLLRVPLFAGLKPFHITEIARRAERIAFRKDGTITQAGNIGDGAYLIVSGEALRMPTIGAQAAPEVIEPGSLIGELAMLVDHVYRVTVVAQGRVNCLKITRAALYEQMEQDPDLADYFSAVLTSRLQSVAAEMRRIDELLTSAAAAWRAQPNAVPTATTTAAPLPQSSGA
jgi:CRP/FNR family transcriptional regulator, cyclic AMP receptor protein